MRGRFFQARKFDGEKYLPRAESKLSSLGYAHNHEGLCKYSYNIKSIPKALNYKLIVRWIMTNYYTPKAIFICRKNNSWLQQLNSLWEPIYQRSPLEKNDQTSANELWKNLNIHIASGVE